MKRKHFLFFSALVCVAFGVALMLVPESFTGAVMAQGSTDGANVWARYFGTNLLAIGVINFFARSTAWSPVMRGVLLGNMLLHLLGLVFDWYSYSLNTLSIAGAMQGTVVHIVFVFGFSYYLFRSAKDEAPAREAPAREAPSNVGVAPSK